MTPTGTPTGGQAKKRLRKGSKYEEDYDAYIESTLTQLRALPPLAILEPQLSTNYGVCPVFGCGDLAKISERRSRTAGELKGVFGAATLTGVSDYYSTRPFGASSPIVASSSSPCAAVPAAHGQPPVATTTTATQRGFYHQEFAWPRLGAQDASSRCSTPCRDTDTPDTVVSSSSPECVLPEPVVRYPGLKYIQDSDNEDDSCSNNNNNNQDSSSRCFSPHIPICAPIPIRLSAAGAGALNSTSVTINSSKDVEELDKENQGLVREQQALKARFGLSPPVPLKDSANVTVTLTLNAAAADDVSSVLCRLANLLRVPPPAGFQIIERTTTPPSQRLGLYRFKGKDGKEGAPVDIQSILNGTAKFCKHCDVVILGGSMISKKASLFNSASLCADPAASAAVTADEDFYFCSSACFIQFAVINRVGLTAEEKAAATVVDHMSTASETVTSSNGNSNSTSKGAGRNNLENSNSLGDIHTAQVAAASILCGATAVANRSLPAYRASSVLSAPEQQHGATTTGKHQQLSAGKAVKRSASAEAAAAATVAVAAKKWKGVRYRTWNAGFQQYAQQQKKFRKTTDNELTDMLYRAAISIRPAKMPDDKRKCMFCHQYGDGVSDGPARLLNFDVDRWVHLNCALWHEEVFEMVNGALMNVDIALKQSLVQTCLHCQQIGATVKCFKLRCSYVYHLGCAIKEGCVFLKNKTVYCSQHVPKNEKDDQLTTLSVFRKVYINRDENRQVAAVMHHSDQNFLLRVGSLTFQSVGQLLPHQLAAFHSPNCIYPIGYQVIRFYWSPRVLHKRCRYICSIEEAEGRPFFTVVVQEPERQLEDLVFKDWTCQGVWQQILSVIEEMRKKESMVRLFPQFLSGEDLFGLTEPAIVRVLESLPGIESLVDYNFKYGRNPLLELPLAVNPTGCARSEPKLRTHFKRFHAQRTVGSSRVSYNPAPNVSLDAPGPYSKQFVHSKSSQYKKMKQEWRHNVYLARSKIQGLGLYAARDIEKHTMVIEYIGEMIRAELAECREKRYDAQNRGIYMFRLDEQRVIDATLCGGLARYINHCCNPNCVAEAVEVERDLRIIIFANRRISRGEELSYDYKFDIEDDHKIPCLCGAPNCRKWMN